MKKLIVTTLITGAMAVSVLAQGTVNLPLQSTRFIQYTTDGTTLTKVPAASPTSNPAQVGTYGNLNVAVIYNPTANASAAFTASQASLLPAGWSQSQNVLQALYSPGLSAAKVFTLANETAPGANSTEVFLVGWTGTFATWDDAFTAGTGLLGWTGSTKSGGSLAWLQGTGDPLGTPAGTPVNVVVGASAYNGLVLAPVPEPSTFALAGLGIASLLIFRRRK